MRGQLAYDNPDVAIWNAGYTGLLDILYFLLNKLIRTAGLLGILDCMFPPKQANQDCWTAGYTGLLDILFFLLNKPIKDMLECRITRLPNTVFHL